MPFSARLRVRTDLAVGMAVGAVLFFWGAWQRRWIADDGLIALRTVRNLLAGHGPVYNIGERVETNTSTLWTAVLALGGLIPGARLEYVALWAALLCGVGAVVFAMLGAARLHGSARLLLPAGVLVYLALPPARDFATSGLETSMMLCWIALLWWLLLRWSQQPEPSRAAVLGTAFVAGLGPLVRPEMTVLAALVLLHLAVVTSGRRRWALITVAGVVPVAYQVFRMGYYALPYPNTAVAKKAGEAKWDVGGRYLLDLIDPYVLWVPLGVFLALGVFLVLRARGGTAAERSSPAVWERAHRTGVVVGLFVFFGVLLLLYVWRVGGDFMHGRVLLPVIWTLLLPFAVFPVRVAEASRAVTAALGAGWLALAAWSAVVVISNPFDVAETRPDPRTGIVDERRFWAYWSGHDHPLLATDYIDMDFGWYVTARELLPVIDEHPEGGMSYVIGDPYRGWRWMESYRDAGTRTVVHVNLGYLGMLVPPDVRVVDPTGLANPIAAATPRVPERRIGHDKDAAMEWMIADSGLYTDPYHMPPWFSVGKVDAAAARLGCSDMVARFRSYRDPLSPRLFLSNIVHSFGYARLELPRDPAEAPGCP